jgi:alkylation response protein AidB-like acyl-CoA dehydrogenase
VDLHLRPEQQRIVDLAESLTPLFQQRARAYDERIRFPREDFDDLASNGLLGATVPAEYGGLHLGIDNGDALTLWLVDKAVAKGDLSLARCFEGHVNMVQILAAIGTEEQKREYLPKVIEEGKAFVAWGSEPAKDGFGTTVAERPDGWVVSGRKAFSTSAGGADYAVLYINPQGTGQLRLGGAREVIMVIVDTADPAIEIDTSWWDPMGMRATVSHAVTFHDLFVPSDRLLGWPGIYTEQHWQAKFVPMFAASFTGAAAAAKDFTLAYLHRQEKAQDPYIQHHVAMIEINVDTAMCWLDQTARLWESGRVDEARIASNKCHYIAVDLALDTVRRALKACGARSALRAYPLELIFRDLNTYVLHEKHDASLATIGRAVLGLEYDPSFHTQPTAPDGPGRLLYPSSP